MNSSELFLIFAVALVVFGPSKLPMLGDHLAKLFRYSSTLKQQMMEFWETQVTELTLKENEKKAEVADAVYKGSKAAAPEPNVAVILNGAVVPNAPIIPNTPSPQEAFVIPNEARNVATTQGDPSLHSG